MLESHQRMQTPAATFAASLANKPTAVATDDAGSPLAPFKSLPFCGMNRGGPGRQDAVPL